MEFKLQCGAQTSLTFHKLLHLILMSTLYETVLHGIGAREVSRLIKLI